MTLQHRREEHAKLQEEVCARMDGCEGNVMELQNVVKELKKELKAQADLFEVRERELRRNNIVVIGLE